MKVTFRVLCRALTASAACALIGLGSLQYAAADGPVAGPGGPVAGPGIAGPGPVADPGPAIAPAPIGPVVDGPAVDAPPPGPALQHHFVNIHRIPGFQQQIEFRTELMLFVDGSFNMIMPAMPDFGDGFCDKDAGPTKLIGTWGVRGNHLIMQYTDGFEDFGLVTITAAGPVLRFDGGLWNDLLAAPAPVPGPGPAPIGGAPVGPAVAGPVGPAVGGPAPIGPAPLAP